MTIYEVHISAEAGVEEPATIVQVTDPETDEIVAVRSIGSRIFRTPNLTLAVRLRDTWNATARRTDDRTAWIRQYEDA